MNILEKKRKLERRKQRIRAKIRGTQKRPRLAVFRSLKHIYAQLIDDEKGATLVSVSDRDLSGKTRSASSKSNQQEKKSRQVALAYAVGELMARQAQKKKIAAAVFDRRGRRYHGRMAAVAAGARSGGLKL